MAERRRGESQLFYPKLYLSQGWFQKKSLRKKV
jgi:hypothetical protein